MALSKIPFQILKNPSKMQFASILLFLFILSHSCLYPRAVTLLLLYCYPKHF
ncbi:hypothetical protein XENIA_75 [Paenibacillus phage Xenia]|uniref:Uncharacterized protein n=1 Tax=Paenibacillus phage Xenia TaxID=1636263 RepID=A0A0K2CYD4_9CAUD|nr:hypothetical protein XENIA_75 [Paenibacillus phage Xenia]ALA12564.1 hypothetical protein XENIA_75 [Paenibacillus phage Xenia]